MKYKVAFILLTVGILVLSACGNQTPEPVYAPETSSAVIETATIPESTPAIEPAPTTGEATTEQTTTAAPTETQTVTQPPTTEAAETTTAAPQTKAEILKLYNNAVSQAFGRRASFTKKRTTNTLNYKDSPLLKPFKSYVVSFMGLDKEETIHVTAGTEHYERYLQQAKLTEADVSSAEYKPDANGGGTITLHVKSGSSSIDGGSDSVYAAPIDRSGIAVGSGDRGEWDHKTAQNAYDAIKDTYAGVKVEEDYSNAVIRAQVGADGALTGLDVDFDLHFIISKILGSTGKAQAHTTVHFTSFR